MRNELRRCPYRMCSYGADTVILMQGHMVADHGHPKDNWTLANETMLTENMEPNEANPWLHTLCDPCHLSIRGQSPAHGSEPGPARCCACGMDCETDTFVRMNPERLLFCEGRHQATLRIESSRFPNETESRVSAAIDPFGACTIALDLDGIIGTPRLPNGIQSVQVRVRLSKTESRQTPASVL